MDFEKDIDHCLSVLKQGGTILYPTDTIWGIGCDATNAEAVRKIYALKQRPESKSMIILLAVEKDLLKYVAHPDPAVFEFLHTTKKPTTVIFEGAIGVADNLIAEDGSTGIRITKDVFCRHLIKRFRKPIVSTSANISGEPAPSSYKEINPEVRQGVDYIVQYRQDDISTRQPSMIVKWITKGSPVIIRP